MLRCSVASQVTASELGPKIQGNYSKFMEIQGNTSEMSWIWEKYRTYMVFNVYYFLETPANPRICSDSHAERLEAWRLWRKHHRTILDTLSSIFFGGVLYVKNNFTAIRVLLDFWCSIFLRIITCIYICMYTRMALYIYTYICTRTPKRNTWIPAKMIILSFRGLSYRVNYVYTYMTICKGYMYMYCIIFRSIVEFWLILHIIPYCIQYSVV